MGVAQPPRFEGGEMADRADEMLVHRIMVDTCWNCIIATIRPKSGMKRPSTPVSFMRRNTLSGLLCEVRISRKQRIGAHIPAQVGRDQLERARGKPRGIRMDRQIMPVASRNSAIRLTGITPEGLFIAPRSGGCSRPRRGPIARRRRVAPRRPPRLPM